MVMDVGLAAATSFKFKSRATSVQTLPSTPAITVVNLDVGRFVATAAAPLMVSGTVMFNGQGYTAGNANQDRYAGLYLNDNLIWGSAVWGAMVGRTLSLTCPTMAVDVIPGDYIDLRAYGGLASTQLYGDASQGSVLSVWSGGSS